MSIDHSAAALSAALRTFGESLGRALAEGITRGVQEGLSQSLDLEQLASRVPRRAAEDGTISMRPAPRRGGRPRGEVRACRISGCPDPARSRGLCSRHYQQELRREKNAGAEQAPSSRDARPQPAPAPSMPVEAKPPMVRKRPELDQAANTPQTASPAPDSPVSADSAARVIQEHLRRGSEEQPRPSSMDAAKRIFG